MVDATANLPNPGGYRQKREAAKKVFEVEINRRARQLSIENHGSEERWMEYLTQAKIERGLPA